MVLLVKFGKIKKNAKVIPPGFEPGTSRVLGERDNHYTTGSDGYPGPRNLNQSNCGNLCTVQPAHFSIETHKFAKYLNV